MQQNLYKMIKNKILFIGTEFKNGKGGIASVLSEYSKIFPNAVFISSTASNGKFKNMYYLLLCFGKLTFYLLKYPDAIVHIHGASYSSFKRKYFLFKFCKKFQNKIIYHIHGGEFPEFHSKASQNIKNKISFFINNADCIICLSTEWKRYFLTNFSPKKIEIIPNIVANPDFVNKHSCTSKFNFLFLGTICEQKGIWLLLDAIEALKQQLNDKFVFKLGGVGSVKTLTALISEKGLNNIVHYVGWVSPLKKIIYLNEADAYILPSYNEGVPISILEAMTYGLPILSTNVGGIPQVVHHHINGILVEPGNKDALVQALKLILDNQEWFKSLGKQSVGLVANHLPINVKKDLTNLYNKL